MAPAVKLGDPKGKKERRRETENKRWIHRETDRKAGEAGKEMKM